jgi:hypothetical protein
MPSIVFHFFSLWISIWNRLLRPEMLKVFLGPGSKKAPVAINKTTKQPTTIVGMIVLVLVRPSFATPFFFWFFFLFFLFLLLLLLFRIYCNIFVPLKNI